MQHIKWKQIREYVEGHNDVAKDLENFEQWLGNARCTFELILLIFLFYQENKETIQGFWHGNGTASLIVYYKQ